MGMWGIHRGAEKGTEIWRIEKFMVGRREEAGVSQPNAHRRNIVWTPAGSLRIGQLFKLSSISEPHSAELSIQQFKSGKKVEQGQNNLPALTQSSTPGNGAPIVHEKNASYIGEAPSPESNMTVAKAANVTATAIRPWTTKLAAPEILNASEITSVTVPRVQRCLLLSTKGDDNKPYHLVGNVAPAGTFMVYGKRANLLRGARAENFVFARITTPTPQQINQITSTREFKDTHIAAWQPVATSAGCSKDHPLRSTLSSAAHAICSTGEHAVRMACTLLDACASGAERPKAPEGDEALRLGPEYTSSPVDGPKRHHVAEEAPRPAGSALRYRSHTYTWVAETRVGSSVELREYGEDSGISMEAKHVREAVRRESGRVKTCGTSERSANTPSPCWYGRH
ncbi:hypothetical protein EDB89DRAFT_1903420 [Lactarius sanguifluus]|nr:hypothetical protein EDB89DRAFT_1903420 [Lactarius sanguifluus]